VELAIETQSEILTASQSQFAFFFLVHSSPLAGYINERTENWITVSCLHMNVILVRYYQNLRIKIPDSANY